VIPNPPDDLTQALLGLSRPTWRESVSAPRGSDTAGIEWFDQSLNESQREAVRFCLTSGQVACIHGPPGVSDGNHIYR
jgi:DNA polymerase alpha-associated DNA helicase A